MILEESPTDLRKFIRELFGLFLLFWALLLFLSLASFDANDPSFNLVRSGAGEAQNMAGLFGAYASGFLNDIFGVCSFLWPLVFAALGATYISASYSMHWWRWCGFFLLTVCLLMTASSLDISIGDLSGGGMVGNTLYYNGKRYLSPAGTFLLWFFIFMAGLQLSLAFSWFNLATRLYEILKQNLCSASEEKQKKKYTASFIASTLNFFSSSIKTFQDKHDLKKFFSNSFKKHVADDSAPPLVISHAPDMDAGQPGNAQCDTGALSFPQTSFQADDEPFAISEDISFPKPAAAAQPASLDKNEHEQAAPAPEQPAAKKTPEARPAGEPAAQFAKAVPQKKLLPRETPVPLPPPDLMAMPAPARSASQENREEKGKTLMACFRDFDIQGELVRITPGPVVTMYEVRPAPGIRVSKIANLADDLSLALKAVAVRIQAPIPGSDTVGIEIPNETRETVNFRELIVSEPFRNGCGPLTMALGKDIAGNPYMADLTKMPHLLVAGATGAGKSVCLNAILVSLLYKTQPEQMKLLLVDPKRIEMAVYADLPHLVHPVVTEMSDAKNALDWAVHEMDNRYKAVARLGVRNVAAYNQKLAAFKNSLPPDFADLEPLPYLVIVIDELADLMMTAAREVETSIVRLAQLARAAGIHMILATQRPSVDVVTGLIKANFPCRISFQVTSKHDSRTILDQSGAEHLLGRGDMLFKPSGGRLKRLHGPFLSDEEVQAVATYWKQRREPSYKIDFSKWNVENASASSVGGDATSDPLYAEAKSFVLEQGRASISLLQRHLKIGFNRAARLMEQFERDGIIGPADGASKPRSVIR